MFDTVVRTRPKSLTDAFACGSRPDERTCGLVESTHVSTGISRPLVS
jgi:hypothetical protein